MAETVVINIEANTQGLQSTIDLLTKLGVVEQKVADEFRKTNEQNVTSLNKGVQATTKEFEKLDKAVKGIKADNQLAKGLDASKEIAKTGNSFTSLRQQFKDATKEVEQLTVQFSALDARTIAAAQKAAELGSEIDNINKQIAALTPEGKFQAIQNLGGAIAGVFQVATGALQAFGVESEQATKIAQQFQGALNIFGGLSQLTQLKDSLTAVKAALGLTTAAQVANTTATEAGVVATEQAAVAQNTLNKAVLSNPYVIAAAALAGLVTAIYLFTESSSDAADEQERLNKALSDVNTQAAANTSELTTGIQLLTQQYQNANTTQEERLQISKQLNELAPETIGWFDAEGNALVDLTAETNKLIAAKIRQAEAEVLVQEIAKLNAENVKTQNSALEDNVNILDRVGAAFSSLYNGFQVQSVSAGVAAKAEENRGEKIKNNETLIGAYTKRLEELGGATTAFANTVEKGNEKIDKSNKKTQFAPAKIDPTVDFTKALRDTEDYYTKLRNLAKANTDNEAELKDLNVVITGEELRKKLELYQQFGRDTSGILAQIAENARSGAVVPISGNIDPFKRAAKEVEDATNDIKPVPIIVDDNSIKRLEETKKKIEELKEQLVFEGVSAGVDTAFAYINKNLEDQIETANNIKDEQLAIIAEEEDALLQSYENRRIGKRELELEQQRLAKQRIDAEKKAEKELNDIRKKQDISNRAQKIFEIAIGTARNAVEQPGPAGALIPFWIGLGAIQAAAVLAQPLPKYKKGTLSVGGVGSEDTELALLQPGEAVIPTETNRRYHPAIKAIYHGKIKPEDINNFVNLKLRGDYSPADARPVTAKMDTSDLYALGRIMKKNDGVYVRNINELAAIIADSYNPRR